ncbi:Crp/Fnr family transcriptional regulator [Phenylobacterium sp. J367]|uniref:Crp/Fnr family transcriptional regulator n=1 Tax=Phenylobacterium sp. J367 TaxID=2898435 RepID=UPI00215092CA|nr:Crp/Fnr family transcriptional regulator [Phenylobacterium sp. J367]MCR5878529.1 Crp/Fnr family transcriptional regulator [Phenylobacterium sp. J367]
MTSPGADDFEQVRSALAASEVLKHISPAAATTLARRGAPVALTAGVLLAQEGDPGDAVFVVLDGEVEIRSTTIGGREIRLTALGRGSVVGEMAVLDGGPRSADMVATRKTRLWRIPRAALMDVLESEPKACVALVAELSRRLRATNADLEARSALDLGGRLARLLLAEQNARGLIALTQTEMARRVGVSREKVNRKLRDWMNEGWVERTASGVRVLVADRLQGVVKERLSG